MLLLEHGVCVGQGHSVSIVYTLKVDSLLGPVLSS